MASFVEDALDLGEVVAVDKGFGGGRIEISKDAVFFEVSVEALANVDGLYGGVGFLGESGSEGDEVLLGSDWGGGVRGGKGKDAITQFTRL